MKTLFEIRDQTLRSLFLAFDTADEACDYWHAHCQYASDSNPLHEAVVVRHDWEPWPDAEVARGRFLSNCGGIEEFSIRYLGVKEQPGIVEDFMTIARPVIDVARNAPKPVFSVIWPPVAVPATPELAHAA